MGEAVMPVIFGYSMELFGTMAFPWLVTACSIFLAAVYLSVDFVSKRAVRNHMLLEQSTHSAHGNQDESSSLSKSGDSSPTGVGGVIFSPLNGVAQEDDDLVQIEL